MGKERRHTQEQHVAVGDDDDDDCIYLLYPVSMPESHHLTAQKVRSQDEGVGRLVPSTGCEGEASLSSFLMSSPCPPSACLSLGLSFPFDKDTVA